MGRGYSKCKSSRILKIRRILLEVIAWMGKKFIEVIDVLAQTLCLGAENNVMNTLSRIRS